VGVGFVEPRIIVLSFLFHVSPRMTKITKKLEDGGRTMEKEKEEK
jgi:hypothetical protein